MHTDPEVRAHLGGARSPTVVAESLPAVFRGDRPQEDRDTEIQHPEASYVIADRVTDRFMGGLSLRRRDPAAPGHLRPKGTELELSYMLVRDSWGQGYAEEATRALLSATASRHHDEPILVVTQSSNVRSIALMRRLGFVEREQFEQFGAQQTLATAHLRDFKVS